MLIYNILQSARSRIITPDLASFINLNGLVSGLWWIVLILFLALVFFAVIASVVEVIKWTQSENKEEQSIVKKILKIWGMVCFLPVIIMIGIVAIPTVTSLFMGSDS